MDFIGENFLVITSTIIEDMIISKLSMIDASY